MINQYNNRLLRLILCCMAVILLSLFYFETTQHSALPISSQPTDNFQLDRLSISPLNSFDEIPDASINKNFKVGVLSDDKTIVGLDYLEPINFGVEFSGKRIALFSTSMDDKFGFFAPITAMLWVAMGWQPIVIAVGAEASWNASALGRVLRSNIERAGGIVQFIPYDHRIYSSIGPNHISQISRLLGGYLPNIPDDAYILITDGDIWPLDPSYYHRIDFSMEVCIMNANDYRRGRSDYWNSYRYPLTNIGAYKRAWRKIINVDEEQAINIAGAFQRDVIKRFERSTVSKLLKDADKLSIKDDMFTAMMAHYLAQPIPQSIIKRRRVFELDELSFVQYIKASPFWRDNIQFLTRKVGKDRLSKYMRDKKWMAFKKVKEYAFTASDKIVVNRLIDAHVGKGRNHAGQRGDWSVLRQLLSAVVKEDDTERWRFIDEYWSEFQSTADHPDTFY